MLGATMTVVMRYRFADVNPNQALRVKLIDDAVFSLSSASPELLEHTLSIGRLRTAHLRAVWRRRPRDRWRAMMRHSLRAIRGAQ